MTELQAGIDGVNVRVTEIDEDLSELYSEIDIQAGQIELVVGNEKLVSESGQVNASIVVSAINDSSVTIAANRGEPYRICHVHVLIAAGAIRD